MAATSATGAPQHSRLDQGSSQSASKHNVAAAALEVHSRAPGKVAMCSAVDVANPADLSLVYTPGVAEPCRRIAESNDQVKEAYKYTMKSRMVAVVSDGSAVLGLGNIGPLASLPVMEGKACLYKKFASVDAFPVIVGTQNVDEIVRTVKTISGGFGGINLEDIAAPQCFEVERRLQNELDIPVFHDDQHGTAIVVTAALFNAAKVVQKQLGAMSVLISGAGAGGTAVAKLLAPMVSEVVVTDSKGPLYVGRDDMNEFKQELAQMTNGHRKTDTLTELLRGADVFIGVSKPNLITKEDVKRMGSKPIIFALANPDPEIDPDEAKAGGAAVVATGRSDWPNQVNNAAAFPGLMKGSLRVWASTVTDGMKRAAAEAISQLVEQPSADNITPGVFNEELHDAVADAVSNTAEKDGVARRSANPSS